jgi:uncharacterized protein (UPF0333 family)
VLSDIEKAALILGAAVVLATGMAVYFGGFQSCTRGFSAVNPNSAREYAVLACQSK